MLQGISHTRYWKPSLSCRNVVFPSKYVFFCLFDKYMCYISSQNSISLGFFSFFPIVYELCSVLRLLFLCHLLSLQTVLIYASHQHHIRIGSSILNFNYCSYSILIVFTVSSCSASFLVVVLLLLCHFYHWKNWDLRKCRSGTNGLLITEKAKMKEELFRVSKTKWKLAQTPSFFNHTWYKWMWTAWNFSPNCCSYSWIRMKVL